MTRKPTVSEAIIGLFEALELRENCGNCRGQGWNQVDIDGDADLCECSVLANEALKHYRGRYQIMVNIENWITPKE